MADANWTTFELAQELLKLFPSFGRLMALYVREMDEEETTMMQMSVLFHIQERSMTTSELAKKRRVSLQAASVLVRGLVERGWLERIPDDTDRRQFLLHVTPDGLVHAQEAQQQMADYLAQFLDALTEAERAAAQVFLPGFQRVVHAEMISHHAEDDGGT